MYCEPWSWRTARPRAIALANPPKCCRTPCRIGSRAWKRVARGMRVDADAFGGAMIDRDEHRAWPSPVIVVVRSVPHIASTVSGMMVPSWLRGPRGEPTRVGASKLFCRISRSTRRNEVRVPA
jgi:hypothetical protein